MERNQAIRKVIYTVEEYYDIQESFRNNFPNNQVIKKSVEVFDDTVDELIDVIIELLGVPNENADNKYDTKNWTKDVCNKLIKLTAKEKNKKLVESAVNLISNWENLSEYTETVEKHTWFYYKELLVKHAMEIKNGM